MLAYTLVALMFLGGCYGIGYFSMVLGRRLKAWNERRLVIAKRNRALMRLRTSKPLTPHDLFGPINLEDQ